MKIYYLFSRNKKIGSRLISWASSLLVKDLDKVPSHAALLIDCENGIQLVVESVLDSGVRIVPYITWQKINEECYKIPCRLSNVSQGEAIEVILISVGKEVSKMIDRAKLAHLSIPHPSGLNRKLNDPRFEPEVVKNIKQYVLNKA